MEGMVGGTFFEKRRAQRRSISGPDRETSWSYRGRELGGFYRAGGRRFPGKPPRNDPRPRAPTTHARPVGRTRPASGRPEKKFWTLAIFGQNKTSWAPFDGRRDRGTWKVGPVGRDLGRKTAGDRAGDRGGRPVGYGDGGFWGRRGRPAVRCQTSWRDGRGIWDGRDPGVVSKTSWWAGGRVPAAGQGGWDGRPSRCVRPVGEREDRPGDFAVCVRVGGRGRSAGGRRPVGGHGERSGVAGRPSVSKTSWHGWDGRG